jgi:CheY-like chemotaxis protein
MLTHRALEEARRPRSELREGVRQPAGFGLRVLLVEDDAANLKLARLHLVKLGCDVETAGNGLEAVERVQEGDYDLVFMDCRMPELDGYEATARIRELEPDAPKRLPIIALTAHAMEGDRDKCLAAGMDDYLAKPISRESVRAMLEKWALPRR